MPCLVNLQPSGKFLMEDFYYAGGLPVVIKEIGKFLHKKALTVNGKTIWDNSKDAVNYNEAVITPLAKPFKPQGGIAVLRGNLAPDGCVLKPSAATPKLMKHKGRAVVFEDIDDLHKRIDDPKLDVDPDCVLVLKNCGPKGYPGFPGGRQLRAAGEDPEEGHHRHDPHFRRADVGHRVRHRRAAHGARSGGGRAARARAQRRHDRDRRRQAQDPPAMCPTRSSPSGRRKWKPLPPHATRGWVKLYCERCCRPTVASTSISSSASRARKVAGKPMTPTPKQRSIQ